MVGKTAQTHIRVDQDLKELIEKKAGDLSINKFLRDLIHMAGDGDQIAMQSLKGEFTFGDVKASIDTMRRSLSLGERLGKLESKLEYQKASNKHYILRKASEIYGIHQALLKMDPSGDTLKLAIEKAAGWEYDHRENFGLKPAEFTFTPPSAEQGVEENERL